MSNIIDIDQLRANSGLKETSHLYKSGIDFIQDNTRLCMQGYSLKELEGKILTIIELMGLGDKQEEAAKSHVRQAIWSSISDYTVVVPFEEFDKYFGHLFIANSK